MTGDVCLLARAEAFELVNGVELVAVAANISAFSRGVRLTL